MRVCVTVAGCSRLQGGLFYAMTALWKAFAARQHQVEIKSVEDAYTEEDSHQFEPLPVKILRCIGPQRLSWSPQMIEYMQAQGGRHDIISSEGLWSFPDYAAGRASAFLDIPHVIHPHGMLDPWALQNSGWKKKILGAAFQKKTLQKAAGVRALCQHEKRSIRAYGYKGPIAVIPNGVNAEQLRDGQDNSVRDAIASIRSDRKILLFLSRVHPKKNLLALIKAWSKLGRFHKDWMLVIAGPDEQNHTADLLKMVSELNLDSSVEIPGPVFGGGKSEWLRAADAFVLPSKSEGFPMVLLEAAAMGLPCVQTPQCHFPELVKAGGAMMSTPKPRDLVMTLNGFLELDESDLSTMGQYGRELIDDQYSWSVQAERIEAFFSYLLGSGSLPVFVDVKAES